MNTEKYKASNEGVLDEADRSLYEKHVENENGEMEKVFDSASHSLIDFSKTHLNFNLSENNLKMPEIENLIKTYTGKSVRKNGNTFGSTIVTLPKDFEGSPIEFFECAKRNLMKIYRLKEEDIVSAWVHMDETTPHMHFCFIPVYREKLPDGQLGAVKGVSWEKCISKAVYDTQHQTLQRMMSEELQKDVHILNDGSLGFDVQNLSKEQKRLFIELDSLKKHKNDLYDQKSELEIKKFKLEKDISFYSRQGDMDKAKSCQSKLSEVEKELELLAPEIRAAMKDLDAKKREISGSKLTAAETKILEIVSTKIVAEEEAAFWKSEAEKARKEKVASQREALSAEMDAERLTAEAVEKMNTATKISEELTAQTEDLLLQASELLEAKRDAILEEELLPEEQEEIDDAFAENFIPILKYTVEKTATICESKDLDATEKKETLLQVLKTALESILRALREKNNKITERTKERLKNELNAIVESPEINNKLQDIANKIDVDGLSVFVKNGKVSEEQFENVYRATWKFCCQNPDFMKLSKSEKDAVRLELTEKACKQAEYEFLDRCSGEETGVYVVQTPLLNKWIDEAISKVKEIVAKFFKPEQKDEIEEDFER